jgi:4-oxalocrotonate tautomerase
MLTRLSLALVFCLQHHIFHALKAYREIIMPYVNIQITKGASRDQKAQLVKEVTDSLVRILGKRPEHIHIVIQEIADEDWGFSGLLTDDWKKQQTPQSQTKPNA